MAAKYEHDRLRADFWRRVAEAKITLISSNDLSDTETTKEQADAFLQQHTPGQQVAAFCLQCCCCLPSKVHLSPTNAVQAETTEQAVPMDEEEEDEFAGME